MFATLLGALPRPPLPSGATDDDLVRAALEAQEAEGLEPLTDGELRWPGGVLAELVASQLRPRARGERPLTVDAWTFAASVTPRAVKQAVPGPYSLGHLAAGGKNVAQRRELTFTLADRIGREVGALARAGCPLVEVHEPAFTTLAEEPEKDLAGEAHARLMRAASGTGDGDAIHLSLAITGGSASPDLASMIASAGYASLAVDLIDGPDNWRLAAQWPGDLGLLCGALTSADGPDAGPEILLWAADYGASLGGRGWVRTGLATASSMAELPWSTALARMRRLGQVVRLRELPPEDRLGGIDPRAVSSRSAALGRFEPPGSEGSRRAERA
ncbi:MAG: hypothetical protein ACJ761_03175 [Chloroflexota bacterium]